MVDPEPQPMEQPDEGEDDIEPQPMEQRDEGEDDPEPQPMPQHDEGEPEYAWYSGAWWYRDRDLWWTFAERQSWSAVAGYGVW